MPRMSRDQFGEALSKAVWRYAEAIESQPTFPNLIASRQAGICRLCSTHDSSIQEGVTDNPIYRAIIAFGSPGGVSLLFAERATGIINEAWEEHLRQFPE